MGGVQKWFSRTDPNLYLNWVSRLAEISGYLFSRVVSDPSSVWGQKINGLEQNFAPFRPVGQISPPPPTVRNFKFHGSVLVNNFWTPPGPPSYDFCT